MDILFINPPFLPDKGKYSREQRSPAITKSGTFYYPMWLAYATGWLEENGYTCGLYDCPASGMTPEDVFDLAGREKPFLAVIDTSTPSIHNDAAFARELKEHCPNIFVLMVGTHVSALPEESLAIDESVDAVAVHEYEETVLELAEELAKKRPSLKKITGIVWRKKNKIIRNPERPLETDLDKYPFVAEVYARHLDYKDYFYSHSRYPIITIVTGRGCPYHCYYCVYPQTFGGHKLRLRSVKNVVDELEYILKTFPDVAEIMFEDDTLTVNKKHALAFADEIIRRGLKFQWSANSRADVDLEVLKALKKAGARLFCVGVESGVQEILDSMHKNLKIDTVRQFFKDSKKAGIKVHGCFILGNRGETRETLETTLQFAKELNPNTAQFFPLMVYPGTEAYDWALEKGFLQERDFRKWLSADGMHNTLVSTDTLASDELVAFCDRARREFYTRPRYIVARLWEGITNPREFKRLFKGFLHLIRHLFSGKKGSKESCDTCGEP